VSLTADDGEGGVTTATGEITVSNVAPVVTITGAPDSVVEDERVSLSSVVGDPGSIDAHTYTWTAALEMVTVATGTEPELSFTPEVAGVYVVTLIVDDGDGGITSTQVLLEVTATPLPASEPAPEPEADPEPEPEPVPEPEPELEPKPSQSNDQGVADTERAQDHVLSLRADSLGSTEFQPATLPESDTVVGEDMPEVSHEVTPLAEDAEPPAASTGSAVSTGFVVTLLGIGSMVVILAGRWIRRRAG
jgi:outer membrane biosynthesis protein TonB